MSALVSAAALYALLDASDGAHAAVSAALAEAGGPLIVVAPALSDAMRLAERYLGRNLELGLLDAALTGDLLLQALEKRDLQEARGLLSADAGLSASGALSLVAAKRLGVTAVLAVEPPLRRAAARQGLRLLPAESPR